MAKPRRLDDPTLGMPGVVDSKTIAPGGPDPNAATPPAIQPPVPVGGFNLEGIRGRLGFGKTQMTDPNAWLRANQDVAQGVSIKGDKMFDPSGKYLADVISNHKQGGTASQFLDGIDSSGKKRTKLKAPKGPGKVLSTAAPVATTPAAVGAANKAPSMDEVGSQLRKLFPDGMYNQQLVDSRTSSVADSLNRNRKSRLATNKAALAERGILNEQLAPTMNRMEEDLYDQFTSSVRDIHADESSNADQRMMLALTTAAGLSTDQARLVLDRFKAENEDKYNMGSLDLGHRNAGINERLGLGNLALGNLNATNSYNLGLGNLGLGRDTLLSNNDNRSTEQLIDLLRIYMGGAQTTTEGSR